MFDQDCKQDEVFEEVARGVIDKYVHHVKVLTESLRQKLSKVKIWPCNSNHQEFSLRV